MRDDVRRRASFGMTVENSTTRVWFCCRSSVVVSEAFNFIDVRLLKKVLREIVMSGSLICCAGTQLGA